MRQRNEPTDTPGARYGEAWTPVAESKLTGPPRHLDIIHVQHLRDARRVPIDGDTKDTWAEWRSQDGYPFPVCCDFYEVARRDHALLVAASAV